MEWLTPKLTRDQYRKDYMAYLEKQIAVNDFNLQANLLYNDEAEAAQPLPGSETMTRMQLMSALNIRFKPYVRNLDLALKNFTDEEIKLTAQNADAIANLLYTQYGQAGLPLNNEIFAKDVRQAISADNLLTTARSQISLLKNSGTPVPSAAGGNSSKSNDSTVPTGALNNALTPSGNTPPTGGNPPGTPTQVVGPQASNTAGLNSPSAQQQTWVGAAMQSVGNVSNAIFGSAQGNQVNTTPSAQQPVNPVNTTPSAKSPATTNATTLTEEQSDAVGARNKLIEDMHGHAKKKEHNEALGKFKALVMHLKEHGHIVNLQGKSPKSYVNSLLGKNDNVTWYDAAQDPDYVETIKRKLPIYGSGFGNGIAQRFKSSSKRGRKPRLTNGTGIASFGNNYNIDTHDLDKHRVTLRYKSNNRKVMNLPDELVGGNLIACLKSVIEGNNPSYKHVSSLSEHEKNYLSQIGEKADIEELASIPSEPKSQTEKEMHDFQVMSGEIGAGNDSRELVQDYKRLLLKLMSKGRIDKTKGKSILMDLAIIGY